MRWQETRRPFHRSRFRLNHQVPDPQCWLPHRLGSVNSTIDSSVDASFPSFFHCYQRWEWSPHFVRGLCQPGLLRLTHVGSCPCASVLPLPPNRGVHFVDRLHEWCTTFHIPDYAFFCHLTPAPYTGGLVDKISWFVQRVGQCDCRIICQNVTVTKYSHRCDETLYEAFVTEDVCNSRSNKADA